MTTQTTGREVSSKSRPTTDPRLVVWAELPRHPDEDASEREPWYDVAALYEEPERWDGMA